ncbi:MAG: hypothetical protein ACRCXQ_06845 [Vagococcus fluvialis]
MFDVYKGKGIEDSKKSVAITFVLRNKERTLEEQEIKDVVEKVVALISEKYKGQIREA